MKLFTKETMNWVIQKDQKHFYDFMHLFLLTEFITSYSMILYTDDIILYLPILLQNTHIIYWFY